MLANFVELAVPAMQREPSPDLRTFDYAAVPAVAALNPEIHRMYAEVLKAGVARCHWEQIGITRLNVTGRAGPV